MKDVYCCSKFMVNKKYGTIRHDDKLGWYMYPVGAFKIEKLNHCPYCGAKLE